MDRALADGDGDVLVGDDAGETLGDAVQFYGERGAGRVDDALSLARKELESRLARQEDRAGVGRAGGREWDGIASTMPLRA
ncbi:hypothetical protein GCM10017750_24230 [Streptomyces racemochromogenes]